MSAPGLPAGEPGAGTQAADAGYVSSVAARPHALTPPGRPPSRWAEAAATLGWVVRSWLRPADAEATWEQRAGREQHPS